MKMKKLLSIITVIFILSAVFTLAAYAHSDNGGDGELADILIPIPIISTPEPASATEPLTPPGNLTVVDDVNSAGIEDKQFITVESKNGNIFYIIVDRAADNSNVHFLNLVDELDLYALLEDGAEPPEPRPAPEPFIPQIAGPEEPEQPSEPKSGSSGSLIAIIVFILLIGGGAGFYFKVLKPKQQANSGSFTQLDELQDSEDEEPENIYIGTGDETEGEQEEDE